MSQKLLIYPLCGGGHFLKWCLLLSPEQDHDWPTHNESSNMNYIRNQVYQSRSWQNYCTVERNLDVVKRNFDYDIIIDHTKFDHLEDNEKLHTAWCYHADEMARVAWQHFVDINLFALAGDESEWETAQDNWNMTILRDSGGEPYNVHGVNEDVPEISYTNTEIKKKQYETEYQNKDNAFFDVDWIWAGFDEKKYVSLCEFFELTPVIDQAEECWNIYATMRNKQIRTFHHWLENTLPNKLKYLKQIQYKYHTK